mmetsp:Transcript_28258/g.73074  ORF Transcript_28258/g.73074 Transcript_28258/m.73074 type:complete len:88 (-) Transcript_28258:62-325(-)
MAARTDNELPKDEAPTADNPPPTAAIPRKETLEPLRLKERNDNELPMTVLLTTETSKSEPVLRIPAIDAAIPTRAVERTDNALPSAA